MLVEIPFVWKIVVHMNAQVIGRKKKINDWDVATMSHTTITHHLKYMLSIPTLYNWGHAFDLEALTSCVSMQGYEKVWIISD